MSCSHVLLAVWTPGIVPWLIFFLVMAALALVLVGLVKLYHIFIADP